MSTSLKPNGSELLADAAPEFPLIQIKHDQVPAMDGDLAEPSSESQKTATSDLSSSDKLCALPPSPLPTRFTMRGTPEISTSVPSVDINPPSSSVSPHRPHSLQNNPVGASSISQSIMSEGSTGREMPNGRESDRMSLPTVRNVRKAFSRINRDSDSVNNSPALPGQAQRESVESLFSRSRSPSRGTSPLRKFQQWSAGLYHGNARDEPFIPIDPFRFQFIPSCHGQEHAEGQQRDCTCCTGQTCCLPFPIFHCFGSSCCSYLDQTGVFSCDTLPRQIYLHLLFRLPALYFSRVAHIFEEAEVSRPDIQRMIDAWSDGLRIDAEPSRTHDRRLVPGSAVGSAARALMLAPPTLPFPEDWNPPAVSPALMRFKNSWEAFIDSLLREWKTLNLVSALLLTAILTMLQIPSAADDPVTRYAALLSLVAALMSLLYGCIFIVRFVTMRSMYKASKWAEEAQKTKTLIFWNVWVLLAMPAIWITWSMIFFIICVLSFVWRTGPSDGSPTPQASPLAALGARIAITTLFVLGIIYFVMIINTLRRYGRELGDREQHRAVRVDAEMNRPATDRARGAGGAVGGDLEAALDRRGRRRERRGAENEGAHKELAEREEEIVTSQDVGSAVPNR